MVDDEIHRDVVTVIPFPNQLPDACDFPSVQVIEE